MPKDSLIIVNIHENGDTARYAVINPGESKEKYNESPVFFYGVAVIVALVFTIRLITQWMGRRNVASQNAARQEIAATEPEALVYDGNELNFSSVEVDNILSKHLPYYQQLSDNEKERFRYRVQLFMRSKLFVIHDKRGFKEMPILLSASAVKLSFGLKNYLLPFYKSIHIFPEEFIGTQPSIRVLAGNVSGNRIHVSWKHFLEGIREPEDGSNLGLHEMAHAYYFQNFETGQPEDASFIDHFHAFNTYGNQVFEEKRITGNVLYSKYAMTNFQEFWAESIELFFEKPVSFRATYPELYGIIAKILNQDPAKSSNTIA